jgi:hypothetical protein
VPNGVPVEWQGQQLHSGPLRIELDDSAPPQASGGVLDYACNHAEAEFHVVLKFPDFADALAGLGIDPELVRPVRAVLRSAGAILDDHGFALGGRCELASHDLFPKEETGASVLPGT